jgi:hypothetical protein
VIQFTRAADPNKRDDNAHVEHKSWIHVRKLMGYLWYNTAVAVVAMNSVHADLRLFQNLFARSVMLLG